MKHLKGEVKATQQSFPLAIVVSQFNQEVTQALLQGALSRLKELDFNEDDIFVAEVPGAVEIPLAAQRLARQNKFQAIITLGAVIRGETSHYDYVCQQVSDGCLKISLAEDLPVVFGILTTENQAQAWDRLGGNHGHKGVDSVDAAISMRNLLKDL